MANTIVEELKQGGILIADGATGTFLMEAGLPAGSPPEAWNLEAPDRIRELHRSYIAAGSRVVLTNTFGGSRVKLAKAGYGGKTREINRAAASLAKEAAGNGVFADGDIGPTGEMMEPFGPLSYEGALEVFSEQAQALVDGGADLLWVETMSDLEEARAAVTAAVQVSARQVSARQVSAKQVAAGQATGIPVFCSLSFTGKGRTMMGLSARQAAEELFPLGLDAIGANCGNGLDPVEAALRQMAEVLPGVPLIAKPNAGLPRLVDGQTSYDTSPAEFAERIQSFIAMGARVVGACCGSNPDYIRAITKRITIS